MGGASWDLKGPMSREVLAGTFKQRNSATRGASSCRKKCKKYDNKNNNNNNKNNNDIIQTINTHARNPCIFGPGCGNTLAATAAFERRLKDSSTMLDRQRKYSQRHNPQQSVGEQCVRELKKTHNCFQIKTYNITLCIMINREEIFQENMDYTRIEFGDVLCRMCCELPDETKQYDCVQIYCLNREQACIS
uniref:Uncharacterized protein LOC111123640 isoform X1 n=1 Tax=Crassostrea virginica TaxID=6565 RepID=A0A8B8D2S7_CRAVI|nr:uncharacterized protein LOC111123640 isoform X1 [Crassostrea virginica]